MKSLRVPSVKNSDQQILKRPSRLLLLAVRSDVNWRLIRCINWSISSYNKFLLFKYSAKSARPTLTGYRHICKTTFELNQNAESIILVQVLSEIRGWAITLFFLTKFLRAVNYELNLQPAQFLSKPAVRP